MVHKDKTNEGFVVRVCNRFDAGDFERFNWKVCSRSNAGDFSASHTSYASVEMTLNKQRNDKERACRVRGVLTAEKRAVQEKQAFLKGRVLRSDAGDFSASHTSYASVEMTLNKQRNDKERACRVRGVLTAEKRAVQEKQAFLKGRVLRSDAGDFSASHTSYASVEMTLNK